MSKTKALSEDKAFKKSRNLRKRKRIPPSQVVIYVVLSLWALTTVYPIIWIIINSFKAKNHILENSFALPLGDTFTLANYRTAFERLNIFSAYRNSLLISTFVAISVMFIAGLAAFALVRFEFKGKKLVNSLIIAGMMFPVFSTIIPVFNMLFKVGLAGTNNLWLSLLSVSLPQIAGNLCFAIVLLSGYIRSLPIDLEEAAHLDGCNTWQIYFKIVVPLARPSFATVGIFSFLWSYNDLFTQMFLLRLPEHRAITRLLNELTAQEGTNYGLMAAAVALVVIPVVIVYIILQKQIIKGMTAGAIKG